MRTRSQHQPKAKSESYAPRSTKRARRTKAGIEEIASVAIRILEVDQPCTCRQLFYRLVSEGVIAKTEPEYKGTVIRLLVRLRMEGRIPWTWIADNTRWVRKPRAYANLQALLKDNVDLYRRDLWRDQPAHVEVWCEKDAIAGVLMEETYPWGVPLFVSRGYASLTFLQSAGAALNEIAESTGKTCHLYYFGDHDPSGVDIHRNTEERLREFAPNASIQFTKVAVTRDQIGELGLQTRPTKSTDTRSKGFDGQSVDVDAIPPHTLRELCRDVIEQHIDEDILERTQQIEEREKESIAKIARIFGEE